MALTSIAALVASGCGSDSDDDADTADLGSAAGSSSAAAPSAEPTGPFGPIRNARDASSLLREPCNGLTDPQLATHGWSGPGEITTSEVSGTPQCRWYDSSLTSQGTLGSRIVSEGLGNLYSNRGQFQRFDITEIGGNPGVVYTFLAPGPQCAAVVLATETNLVDTTFAWRGPIQSDPCEMARELALTALNNLKPVA